MILRFNQKMKGSFMPHGYYHHLTLEQRCQIYAFLQIGKSQSYIALQIAVSQPTISRELRRNGGKKGYRYKQAHEKSVQRRRAVSKVARKMTPQLIASIETKLVEDQLSPEQISGRFKLENNLSISYESIYRFIWEDKFNGGKLYTHLRRSGKKYNKRGSKLAGRGLIPNRTDISERPAAVNEKIRVGDIEIDTIIGANHKGAIVSIVERKTKLTLLRFISSTKAEETAMAIIDLLTPIKTIVKTVTSDNGKEFSQHRKIAAALNIEWFFSHPYHSWERGLNENTNGLIRQYFPKHSTFTNLIEERLLKVQQKLNNRPRKTLNYQTPNEEFLRLTGIDLNYALRN